MKHILILIIGAVFMLHPEVRAQETNSVVSTADQFKDDFQNVPCKQNDRQPAVRALFEKMGASPNALSVENLSGVENVVLKYEHMEHDGFCSVFGIPNTR
jgi:hypothetical protein